MDGKFYVVGGTGAGFAHLSCGEVYDLKNGTWTEIVNISPVQPAPPTAMSGAPPLIAVVKNEMYAADYVSKEVKKYNKEVHSWVPGEGPPQWDVLGRKQGTGFVYNCAVMGC
ncbi:hypothetical protein SASPL_144258 [Salvia splendens]|uniref:Uncharacterized protein n=1 Tax=Salvia splendens TaxID=180675 RepID=A0A8X8ZA83_SALSN|nr:hypothetical protein SASPL_144258 [Salvia splendens]